MILPLLLALQTNPQPVVRCLPDDPAICTAAVERGQSSPFSGTLYSAQAAAETTAALEAQDEALRLAVTATASIWRIRWEGAVRLGEERVKLRDDELVRLRAEQAEERAELFALREEIRDPPFYRDPAFLVLGSVLLTATAIVVPVVVIVNAEP